MKNFKLDLSGMYNMAKTSKANRVKKAAPRRKGLTTKGKGSRVNDVAAVSETYRFDAMALNVIYADYGCSLFQHERARQVAQGYMEFRIKLIEYRFKPLSDTYDPTEGTKVPYLYYLVDRLRSNNGLQTLDAFTQAGAKAVRFDDKTLTVKFKPYVLMDTWDSQTLVSVPRSYRVSPWLTTNDYNTIGGGFKPSEVDHLGLRWIIDGGTSDYTYEVERVVHIEFRKPMWIEAAPEGSQLTVVSVDTLIAEKLNPKPIVPDVPLVSP